MIKQIKKSKLKKTVAIYLTIMIFLESVQPMQMYALTSGPTQPEFKAFTPIDTSDMVNLSNGDFNYNIPIMDVGGYPLNLAYNSGVTMDSEASWVGLGWNLNVGQIERQVRGLPDDFKGDKMTYDNDLRENRTIGANFYAQPAFFGENIPVNIGMGIGVQYNNYEGITFKPSFGITYEISDNVSIGASFSSSVGEGATVSPSVTASRKTTDKTNNATKLSGSFGVSLNSRKGLEAMSLSASYKKYEEHKIIINNKSYDVEGKNLGMAGVSGSISFNDQSYTPTKRIGFSNSSFSYDGAFGVEIFGVETQMQITGYGSYQGINPQYKHREMKAFGYENTQHKNQEEGVLDFNREKEENITVATSVLPTTNYTYDTYTIDGQGVGGMFRPHRSQVSHVYNDDITDYGDGSSAGFEFGGANLIHGGVHMNSSSTTTRTGRWNEGNNALPLFTDSNHDGNKIDYEPHAYKLIGEMNVDSDDAYNNKLLDTRALRFNLEGGPFNWKTTRSFKTYGNTGVADVNITEKIKRTQRLKRRQLVEKVTNEQALKDPMINRNTNAQPHHTAGIKVLQPGGSLYVYGETVYNKKKVEATFDVTKPKNSAINSSQNRLDETVNYFGANGLIAGNSTDDSDHYLNKITTPGYAHAYLLTSVLSTDYEDLMNDGPTDDDLGTYTKFVYTKTSDDYKWRVPFRDHTASYNRGLYTDENDDKGNYLYGEKEVKYVSRIETKTHIAYFDLETRVDALGVAGEEGHFGDGRMKRLKSIRLYSKSALKSAGINLETGPGSSSTVYPIKTAFFEYSYKLCTGTPSSQTGLNGKLTLDRVYFTYGNSNMGKFTPYKFEYAETYQKGQNLPPIGFKYAMKGNDIWGNYKPVGQGWPELTNSEFPFTEQDPYLQNQYAVAWTLNKVTLPSGGAIAINAESDDYQYVQNRKAMQMFKIVGAGNNRTVLSTSDQLYSGIDHKRYIYAKLSDANLGIGNGEAYEKYISQLGDDLYFRFFLNMNDQKDFVSGYFRIDKNANNYGVINNSDGTYLAIPVQLVKMGGGVEGSRYVSPIAKAGWSFGRRFLNRYVYSLGGDGVNKDFSTIVKDLVGSIASISEIWKGPNKVLEENNCAKYFEPAKSWVRLNIGGGRKLGGGLRVKSVELSDNWKVMTNNASDIYNQQYGQEYSYDLQNGGGSSGVATFEPNGSPENPFVKPYYAHSGSFEDALSTRKYVEEPFGETFFPSATVTYSRVTVKNKIAPNGNKTLLKHGTGSVVTEHYTTKDFPTIVRLTDLDLQINEDKSSLFSMLDVWSINHITGSQGFSIETNDMNGRVKQESVYAERTTDTDAPISYVEYKYNVDANGRLDNNLTTINSKGVVETHLLGVTNDLITDFNESNSESETMGTDTNIATFLIGIFPLVIPMPLPKYASHENILRTATTTKVVHKTGVLIEKIAHDVDAVVSTKNLAWDASSGDVLLTETVNEYNDHYFSFNYPAYWKYEGMGLASTNIGIEGKLMPPTGSTGLNPNAYFGVEGVSDLSKIFLLGDELVLDKSDNYKYWVVGFNANKTRVLLMDRYGRYLDECGTDDDEYTFRIVRSGYRNLQNANMASVTSMNNPIDINGDGITNSLSELSYVMLEPAEVSSREDNPRIVNASAVLYNDYWRPQDEMYLPPYPTYVPGAPNNAVNVQGDILFPYNVQVNPYVWNIKGDWKAQKSYAYLTGRSKGGGQINNPRHDGFFTTFTPFYQLVNGGWDVSTDPKWKYASSVTQTSPYGAELENKDALDRYSAAQYGYNFNLPMAVASNSMYKQMGFEGFEETQDNTPKHFAFKTPAGTPAPLNAQHSHTGKRSVKVTQAQPVKLLRKLTATPYVPEKLDCPIIIGPGGDYQICYVITAGPEGDCEHIGSTEYYHRDYFDIYFTGGPPLPAGWLQSHLNISVVWANSGGVTVNDVPVAFYGTNMFQISYESECGDQWIRTIRVQGINGLDLDFIFTTIGGGSFPGRGPGVINEAVDYFGPCAP